MKWLPFLFLIVSCASDEVLQVRQFHMTEVEVERDYHERHDDNQFIRGEINRRTYGSVTAKEREAQKGNYYTVKWKKLTGTKPVRVVLDYRQVASGARVKRMERLLTAVQSGSTEFEITGTDYVQQGRVLSWRISLFEGNERVAEKKSYLWH
jgi:hypothetical protein